MDTQGGKGCGMDWEIGTDIYTYTYIYIYIYIYIYTVDTMDKIDNA